MEPGSQLSEHRRAETREAKAGFTLSDLTIPDEAWLGDLTSRLAELTAGLSGTAGDTLTPDRIVALAADVVPHVDHAALTIVEKTNPQPRTVAATGQLPHLVDQIQYQTGQGPCLEALEDNDITAASDLRTDRQWPEFARRAVAETPVRSMFGVRLLIDDIGRGALNFYSEDVETYHETDFALGALFASYASLALLKEFHEASAEHLRTALESSRQIGMAIGILMARHLMTSDQAMAALRRASNHLQRKVRDIAVDVTETGQLPAYD